MGGDRAPNVGLDLVYNFDVTPIGTPEPIGLERDAPSDTRFVTWNTRDLSTNGSFNAGASAAAQRIFAALDPEVICFQELRDVSAPQTAALIEGFLPSEPGEAWHSAQQDDNIVVSRFAILASWAVDRNLAVLLDADAALGADVLLLNAHFPCCDNDFSRQDECDAVMAFFRDAKNPGGGVTVPSGTIFVLTGDLNLVGFSRQLTTLLTGDILDNGAYGPDFDPDWDGTDLADVVSWHTESRYAYTWRNDFSSFAPGRLDFFIYSDSATYVAKSFIIYTPEMSSSELSQYGLISSDVTTVSDHLPHVADFRITATDSGAQGADTGNGLVHISAMGPPGSDMVRLGVNLDVAARLRIDVFDVRGAFIRTIQRAEQAVFAPGAHTFEWNGRSGGGRRVANGTYFVRVTARSPNPSPNSDVLGEATSKILVLHP
jgi:exonuclease III